MKNSMRDLVFYILCVMFIMNSKSYSQSIPMDTSHLEIQANAFMFEKYKGEDAIYLQGGGVTVRDLAFLNGTIEYDVYLKKEQAFPGVYFRSQSSEGNAEQFYLRPHLPGKPDANQALPTVKGLSAWQLYFGEKYSFPYTYTYDDWTHVKIVVNGDKAQVFLDHSDQPNLSWTLFHPAQSGSVTLTGGNRSGMHLANIKIDPTPPTIVNFEPKERKPIKGVVPEWEISDKFPEESLDDLFNLSSLIQNRIWQGKISVEEGVAANISKIQMLRDGKEGNTVFAKLIINSDRDQTKLFEFGYSDRVVAILNGKAIYKGNNRWRSRDYRYLGTIGLFDAIYLDLKEGENILLMAVSEDFGGWLITGKFKDENGISIGLN